MINFHKVTMKYIFTFIVCTLTTSLYAVDVDALAKKLDLYAGTKAVIQWERVFSSSRYLQRYHIDTLNEQEKIALKRYLIDHAADSDQPIVPGL